MKINELTSHMITPKALLNTPLTSWALLRRLGNDPFACCFFLLLDMLVGTATRCISTIRHCMQNVCKRLTDNHTPYTSRPCATGHHAARNDSSCSSYT